MYYRPTHFELYEVLPKNYYNGNKHKGANLWFLFDNRVLWTMDRLRKRFGRIAVNTWYWGGSNQYRGYRPFDCGVGAELSQHKFGRAIDSVPLDVELDEVRSEIINNPTDPDYKYISCIEIYVPWLHIDCRNWDKKTSKIMIIKP